MVKFKGYRKSCYLNIMRDGFVLVRLNLNKLNKRNKDAIIAIVQRIH